MKYKHAEAIGWYYTIDDNGIKSQSWSKKNKPKMYEEMQAWVASGNTIEPQYTTEEQAQKDADDLQQSLDNQKSRCIQILNEIDHKFLPNYRRPDDVPQWQTYQDQIIAILGSSEVQEIPAKPF